MKNISLICLLLILCFGILPEAAAQLKLTVDNPIIKAFIKKGLEEYIPKVTGKNEKIRDISFITNKKTEAFTALKGTILFENPKAALGNGNYRFKLKIGNNLLKPKIHYLKLQVARIWFIRFYKRAI